MDETIDALLAEMPDTRLNGNEYDHGGVVFAALLPDNGIEIHLGADIADAALRTPDTAASTRGDGWVLFAPREWDDHARDRLEAWFRVAWRMAERH